MIEATIDISEHVSSAAKEYFKSEGKEIIDKAIEDYFNGKKYLSKKKAIKELKTTEPTFLKWKRKGLINSVIIAGAECYTIDEIERVKEAGLLYKRGI